MAQESTRGEILEAEPPFGFHADPVDGAAAAGRGYHDVSVEERDYTPGRDGADDEGGAGPGDRSGGGVGVGGV